jgi:hypothetical protein
MKYDLGTEEKSFLTSERLNPLSPPRELHYPPPGGKQYSWDSNHTYKSAETNYSESNRPFHFDVGTIPPKQRPFEYEDHYLSEGRYEENHLSNRTKPREHLKPKYEDYYLKHDDKSYRRYEDIQRREEKNLVRMRYEEGYSSDSGKEMFIPRDIPQFDARERKIRYDEHKGSHVPTAKEGRPPRYPLAGTSQQDYHRQNHRGEREGLEREYRKRYQDSDKYLTYGNQTRREHSEPIYETVPRPIVDLNLNETRRYPEEKLISWTPERSDTSSDRRTKPCRNPVVRNYLDDMMDVVDLESLPTHPQKDNLASTAGSKSEEADKSLRQTPEGEKRVGLDLLMEKFEEELKLREAADQTENDESVARELLHRTTQTSPQHQPSPCE